ncbi:MAG: hypothetical protein IT380_17920 [Myxococcales bacterium]|nr:hypothetical protein [Myxococcales bacterium]
MRNPRAWLVWLSALLSVWLVLLPVASAMGGPAADSRGEQANNLLGVSADDSGPWSPTLGAGLEEEDDQLTELDGAHASGLPEDARRPLPELLSDLATKRLLRPPQG